jgi:type I restriction enzyme, S subunit
MAGEWREVSLEEVADELTVGYVGPMASAYVDDGVPFLRSLNVEPHRINRNDLKFITPEFHQRIQKSRLTAGDVVIVRTGKPGACSVVPDWLADANCSDLVIVRCGKQLNNRFLAYYVNTAASNHVAAHLVGAVQQHFNVGSARTLRLNLPPLPEQEAIASVLGTLDDKIELNRRMNATLEAMARALFQSWFVDFDPVRAKLDGREPVGMDAETAALFPDAFEESVNGSIPQGWKSGEIGDIGTNFRRGIQPREIAPTAPYIALEHMPRRCIALGKWDESTDVASGKLAFREGEILFGKLRPYFHKVGVAPIDGVCSTDILVVAPKSHEWFGFLLGHMSSDRLIQFVDIASTGTKMPRTNWSEVSSFRVALPTEPIAAAFTRGIQPMLNRIHANLFESRTLSMLRDTLLPKLLSGEVELNDAVGEYGP